MSSHDWVGDFFRERAFHENPFDLREPERETLERVSSYFSPHPFFSEILGVAEKPATYIIFALRGAGKTTMRQLIELYCREGREPVDGVLAVPYTDFSRPIDKMKRENSPVDVDMHIEEILRCAVRELLENFNPTQVLKFKNIRNGDLAAFSTYIHNYSRIFDPEDRGFQLNNLFKHIANTENQKDIRIESSALFTPGGAAVIDSLPDSCRPAAELLVKLQQQPPRNISRESYKSHLRDFVSLLRSLGYSTLYVLIDRIDENSFLNEAASAAAFIAPLLKDIELLDFNHTAFKIFLPQHIRPYLDPKLRRKRLYIRDLVWDEDQLLKMLKVRLLKASNSQVDSMQIFCEPELNIAIPSGQLHAGERVIDVKLVQSTGGLPRNLVLRCLKLFEIFEARGSSGLVTLEDLTGAIEADLGNDEPPVITSVPSSSPASPSFDTPEAAGKQKIHPALGLYIDENDNIWCDDAPIVLAPILHKLFKFLWDHADRISSNEEIIDAVWGMDYGDSNLHAAITTLRKKLKDTAKTPRFIQNFKGRGFRLRIDESPNKD